MEYIVAEGDTIQSIADRYNVSPERLMRLNNLRTNDDLRIGMVLLLETVSFNKAGGWQEDGELPYCGGAPHQGGCNPAGQNARLGMANGANDGIMYMEELDPGFTYPDDRPSNGTQPGRPNRPPGSSQPSRPPSGSQPSRPPSRPPIVIRPTRPPSGTVVYPPNYWQPNYGQIQFIEPQLQGLNYAWEEADDFRYILSTDKYRYREGQRVNITFRKRNLSDKTVVLRYPSSQLFDFYISDQQGNELWRWSDTRSFSNVMREIVLSPRQAETINITWDQRTTYGYWIPAQTLTLWGVNTATNVSIPLEIVIY